jgi:hypothetical protein
VTIVQRVPAHYLVIILLVTSGHEHRRAHRRDQLRRAGAPPRYAGPPGERSTAPESDPKPHPGGNGGAE